MHQLQEIFLNLFINACQAMERGGTLTIRTAKLDDNFAEITITDTGVGIAPINLKNLFMPFFSTKKDGTGLGLSICYNIIKNHNGTIDVHSQLNQGTTFIIKLPFIKKGG
jgi:signal transduction histidine kinase